MEKEAQAVLADSGKWVTWAHIDPTEKNDTLKAEFKLGDFAIFGQFLHELVGSVRQQLEVRSGQ